MIDKIKRPIQNCRFGNPEDGCCLYPDKITPECHIGDCPFYDSHGVFQGVPSVASADLDGEKIKLSGDYPLNGIKYFQPEDATFSITCPDCSKIIALDMFDIVEYPKRTQLVEVCCVYCECEFKLDIDIALEYNIFIKTTSA